MILPRGLPRALMDNYLAPLFEEITRLSDRGVLVTDHRLAAPMAPSVRAFCSIARVVNDLRGTTDLTAGPQTPALVGACHCCDVEGVAALSTVAYLGAHRQLPVGHELRAEWGRTLTHVERVDGAADRERKRARRGDDSKRPVDDGGGDAPEGAADGESDPYINADNGDHDDADDAQRAVSLPWSYDAEDHARLMHDADVRACFRRMGAGGQRRGRVDVRGYKRAPALATAATHLDMVHDIVVDPVHELMNLGRGLVRQLRGATGATPAHMAFETLRRRGARSSLPILTDEQRAHIDLLCMGLRLSHGNGRLPRLFNEADQSRWKAEQWLQFFSPVGLFLVSACRPPIPQLLRKVLVDIIWWVWCCSAYTIRAADLPRLRLQGYELMTKLELLSPFGACTISRHYVSHFVDVIERHGPLSTVWM